MARFRYIVLTAYIIGRHAMRDARISRISGALDFAAAAFAISGVMGYAYDTRHIFMRKLHASHILNNTFMPIFSDYAAILSTIRVIFAHFTLIYHPPNNVS